MKVCGGGPEPCCSVTNIGDFDGDNFHEGAIDEYSGFQLEGCFNYALTNSEGASDLSLTIYHEGSDGGQLDWVEIHTDSHTVTCPSGYFIFLILFIISNFILGFWTDGFTSIKVACFSVLK